MPHQARSIKIVVVDDSLTARMRVKELLEDENTTVALAEDGRQGIQALDAEEFDCLLLDYEMPDMNGIEFLTKIRDGEDRLPLAVVMLTGTGSESLAVDAMKRGVHDYLVKTELTSDTLRRVIHDAIDKAGAERERVAQQEQMVEASQTLAKANLELSRMTRLDPLTNLFNRRAIDDSLSREHERGLRGRRTYSILMIDIDCFKLFNDSQGHQAGDDCLQQIARCVQQTVREMDIAGRYGGEEFIVLAPDTDLAGARMLGGRICKAVSGLNIPHPVSPTADHVTISLGVASGLAEGWQVLVKQADDALYSAKESGRNRVCVYEGQRQHTIAHAPGQIPQPGKTHDREAPC